MFSLTHEPIDAQALRGLLQSPTVGAIVCFEGLIRNHNEGRKVSELVYEAYEALALKEGLKILQKAQVRFGATSVHCVHRLGKLKIGEIAVWVGASSDHRREAFETCSYVIEQVKKSVPIWKHEYYADGTEEWVNCAGCGDSHSVIQ